MRVGSPDDMWILVETWSNIELEEADMRAERIVTDDFNFGGEETTA